MIVTKRGTVLCYCEARDQATDWARMDLLLFRSEDGGKTFGEPIVLARGDEKHPTVNNPVMMEDKKGRIHLLHCEDYGVEAGRILHAVSGDDGKTWSEKEDITYATRPDYRNVFAIGPGHGICTSRGILTTPIWMVPKRVENPVKAHVPSEIATLYSKDDGETWKMGQIVHGRIDLYSPNEAELAETASGKIYWNFRVGGGLTYRGRAYSRNGYRAWRRIAPEKALCDPGCFGSVVAWSFDGKPVLAFGNCSTKVGRKRVTVQLSFDEGRSWTLKREIDPECGGYVELASNGEELLVLSERNFGETVVLTKLTKEDFQ